MQNIQPALDSAYTSSRDTLVIYDVPPELMNTYHEILQNTNSQLSLSHNPLALAIGFLGVLFTIAAIAAGWFIYRQGKEFEQRQNNFLENASTEYKALIDSYKQTIDSYVERLKTDTDELNERLKTLGIESNNNGELEELFRRMKDIQQELKNLPRRETNRFTANIVTPFNSNGKLTCKKCLSESKLSQVIKTDEYWHCPICSNQNQFMKSQI